MMNRKLVEVKATKSVEATDLHNQISGDVQGVAGYELVM
jgi:hypothetical protein